MSERDWRAIFDEEFRNIPEDTYRRVWRDALGDEYPEGLDSYSFVGTSELRQMADALQVGPGKLLGDLGCGRGGPGLWLAAKTGADLVGVDISAVAIAAATSRAARLGLNQRVRYQRGTFEETGLADGELDAIASIDALIFAPDKRAAAVEFARVLAPGGRLVVTTWDYHRQPAGRPPQVSDHSPLLTEAGLRVVSYLDTDDWRRRALAVVEGLMANADDIAAATGQDASEVRANVAEMGRSVDDIIRRVLIVAERG